MSKLRRVAALYTTVAAVTAACALIAAAAYAGKGGQNGTWATPCTVSGNIVRVRQPHLRPERHEVQGLPELLGLRTPGAPVVPEPPTLPC
jgi:hypothetical protein